LEKSRGTKTAGDQISKSIIVVPPTSRGGMGGKKKSRGLKVPLYWGKA